MPTITNRTADRLVEGMEIYRDKIPYGTLLGVYEYVLNRIPQGHFLTAVLSNDLFTAVCRADDVNTHCLVDLCKFLYNYVPAVCYGSPAKVHVWLNGSEKE